MTELLTIREGIPELLATLREAKRMVLVAPPGTGKTTLFPVALAEAVAGTVYVTQPRRLAARMAATYVAGQRGEAPGGYVGYRIRFDSAVGPKTRLIYMTEGVLRQQLLRDRQLNGVSAVIVDEFHERSLDADVLLGLLTDMRKLARPDLLLAVMSATVAAESVAEYLDNAPIVKIATAAYPVAVEYLARDSDLALERRVGRAVKHALEAQGSNRSPIGDVLVFLPGVAEIQRAQAACQDAFGATHAVLPLHGSLSASEQDLAVRPGRQRKIVLATNVAETSITIDGVTAVIDTGLVRRSSVDPWSGLSHLRTDAASQAEAIQRAGRAGRTQPGICFRLFSEHEFKVRPKFAPPEIATADLTATILALARLGYSELSDFPWYESPPAPAIAAARSLLIELGALSAAGGPTSIGERLSEFPIHPRLGRIALSAAAAGAGRRGALLAAIMAEAAQMKRSDPTKGHWQGPSDPLAMLEDYESRQTFWPQVNLAAVRLSAKQIAEALKGDLAEITSEPEETLLRRAILSGFPDRVARRRISGGKDFVLADGGSLQQDRSSVVHKAEWVVVTEADMQSVGTSSRTSARSLSQIEPDWLLDDVPDRISECSELIWDGDRESVVRSEQLKFGNFVMAETRRTPNAQDLAAASTLLAKEARAVGLQRFDPKGVLATISARLAFAGKQDPSDPNALLETLCLDKTSFAELENAISGGMHTMLSKAEVAQLNRIAPEEVSLPSGRKLAVNYVSGQEPWVASYLQDFFGQQLTPRIGDVPLVLHLWAPNKRAVQITRDLAGFWQNHYPAVRRELMRQYPRHTWPEDPLTAPPKLTKRGHR